MKKKLFFPNFSSIWKKYTVLIAAVSIISLLISGLLTMYIEINNINKQIDSDLNTLLSETALSFSDPLWEYNYTNLQLLTEVLTNRSTIYEVQIKDYTRGLLLSERNPLYQPLRNEVQYGKKEILKNGRAIGTIQIGIVYAAYADDLYRQLFSRLIQSLLEVSAYTAVILWISYTITKPLKALEITIDEFASGDYSHFATVEGNDEIARLAIAFNAMARQIEEADYELRTMNASLEQLVVDRTYELMVTNDDLKEALAKSQQIQAELTIKNDELNKTLDSLQAANKEIIEATKSNLTSQLIAGVAHEINTPVGIMLTTNTFLLREIENFNVLLSTGNLKKTELDSFIELISEATQNTQRNLNNTVALIHNFKEVAVDQTSLRQRRFDLKSYLEEVISTIKPAFKHRKISLQLECPNDIQLNSYPGAYSQVFTNLILNSIKHAFKEVEEGTITILVKQEDHFLIIDYLDNGCGVAAENLPEIFTPFFSTEHNRDGSGLGLSVVKNLIEKTLSGTVTCSSEPNQGIHFSIKLPLEIEITE